MHLSCRPPTLFSAAALDELIRCHLHPFTAVGKVPLSRYAACFALVRELSLAWLSGFMARFPPKPVIVLSTSHKLPLPAFYLLTLVYPTCFSTVIHRCIF